MGNIIIRSKKFKKTGFSLSEDARKRAYDHLKSLGYRDEELKPIEWPDDAVSAYRDNRHATWKFTTIADILRRKIEKMERNLRWKREYNIIEKRPLYVWVFWCPGISDFFFKGWWIYLIGREISECVGERKDNNIIKKLLELFPLIEPNLFGWRDILKWKRKFVHNYRCGCWCGKPQGKAPVWAEINGDRVLRILGPAKWPSNREKKS